jgi:hypothetical protein
VFAKAKPGYHPITTGSVQEAIEKAKPAPAPPADAPKPGNATEVPTELDPVDPTKPETPAPANK